VVVGAGFGGLWAAKRLLSHRLPVTVVDRNNYHTFFPLLYQVAAAELGPGEIAYPVRSVFRKQSLCVFRRAEVRWVDLEAKRLTTEDGTIDYDYLVLAPGSVPNFFGVDGAEEHAFPLRTMDDAIPLRYHVLDCFERAAQAGDAEARTALLRFVIVGGGHTGVEFAGALAELIYGPLLEDYAEISRDEVEVRLIEGGAHLLPGMAPRLQEYAHTRLVKRRVKIRLGAQVQAVDPGRVVTSADGALATHTVVWAAGVRGDPAVGAWGLPIGRAGRVPVEETLQVPGHPEVFVVGDLAYLESGGTPLPQVAQVALQQGATAADNIVRLRERKAPRPFVYKDLGVLAVVGRNAAVAQVWGRTFTGLPAWVLWLTIHLAWLIGFRNRLLVLVNWAWNYIFYRRAVRLILPNARGRRTDGEAGLG